MSKASAPIDYGYGKLPPHSTEMEEAILGAIILESPCLPLVSDVLRTDSFYKEAHQRIYGAIMALFAESQPIDMLTIPEKLISTGELELCGGRGYIMGLTMKVNSSENIEYWARIVVQTAIKRDLIRLGSELSRDGYDDTTDVFELLDRTEASVFALTERSSKRSATDMGSNMRQALQDLDKKKNTAGGMTGIASGLSSLDRLTSGWQRGELIVVAARPAMGKTALVVSATRNAAIDFNVPVALFSLEMSTGQITNRMISSEAEIEGEKIRRGSLTHDDWDRLHQRIQKLIVAPIFIDDTPALSVLELRSKCRRLKSQHGIGLIIVDYLQLMSAETNGKGKGNREQEIAYISRSLKNLAKELDVPVIALSQLSRSVESRGGDKRPMLSDLRESGSIEQDADMVIFLYRPEYYGITEDEAGNSLLGVAEIIVAKNRAGSLDTIKAKFTGKYTKFSDQDSYVPPQEQMNIAWSKNEALDQVKTTPF